MRRTYRTNLNLDNNMGAITSTKEVLALVDPALISSAQGLAKISMPYRHHESPITQLVNTQAAKNVATLATTLIKAIQTRQICAIP